METIIVLGIVVAVAAWMFSPKSGPVGIMGNTAAVGITLTNVVVGAVAAGFVEYQ